MCTWFFNLKLEWSERGRMCCYYCEMDRSFALILDGIYVSVMGKVPSFTQQSEAEVQY